MQGGYISEKFLLAFVSGCIPIYFGTSDVSDIFNRDAFVYFDVNSPQSAVERSGFWKKTPPHMEE